MLIKHEERRELTDYSKSYKRDCGRQQNRKNLIASCWRIPRELHPFWQWQVEDFYGVHKSVSDCSQIRMRNTNAGVVTGSVWPTYKSAASAYQLLTNCIWLIVDKRHSVYSRIVQFMFQQCKASFWCLFCVCDSSMCLAFYISVP